MTQTGHAPHVKANWTPGSWTSERLRQFVLHWRANEQELIEGVDIADAIRRAGYGGGALRALDYWEEIKGAEAEAKS